MKSIKNKIEPDCRKNIPNFSDCPGSNLYIIIREKGNGSVINSIFGSLCDKFYSEEIILNYIPIKT